MENKSFSKEISANQSESAPAGTGDGSDGPDLICSSSGAANSTDSASSGISTSEPQHPLLLPPVLRHLFSLFEGDLKSLRSIRSVCQTWNQLSTPAFKKSATWVSENLLRNLENDDEQEDEDDEELEFLKFLTGTDKKDIFSKFIIVEHGACEDRVGIQSLKEQDRLNQLVKETMGPFTTELDLRVNCLDFINMLLPHLSNLRKLELYTEVLDNVNLSNPDPCQHRYVELNLPNLEALSIFVLIDGYTAQNNSLPRKIAMINSMIRKSPNLKFLQVDGMDAADVIDNGVNALLDHQQMEQLTSITFGYNWRLKSHQLKQLTKVCPKLKNFTAAIQYDRDRQEVLRFLHHFAPQLEDLYLTNLVDEHHARKDVQALPSCQSCASDYGWPPFPSLKSLTLKFFSFCPHHFNFQAPKLKNLWLEPFFNPCDLKSTNNSVIKNVEKLQILNGTERDIGKTNFSDRAVNGELLQQLAVVYPNVKHLETWVEDDESLRTLFTHWTGLEHLGLGNSKKVTDSGITGLEPPQLEALAEGGDVSLEEVKALRSSPFIGDLKGLKEFSICNRKENLTQDSIRYGFAWLPGLVELKEVAKTAVDRPPPQTLQRMLDEERLSAKFSAPSTN